MAAWWFERVRIGLKQKRPYGVEKLVEPDVFKKAKSGYSHNNKWTNYKSGKRVPRASLIVKAEALLPGSSASFAHPIWRVGRLKADEMIAGVASEWLHELNVGMLPWFFRIDTAGGAEVRRGISARTLRQLAHRADLDALAAISIILREASEGRRYKLAMAAGEALYLALLRASVGGSEQMQIVLPKISAMLVTRVFPFARDRYCRYCFDGLDLSAFYELFRLVVGAKRDALGLSANSTQIADLDTVINGGFCKDFGFLHFSMPKRPLISTGSFRESEKNYHAHMDMWQTAISNMLRMNNSNSTLEIRS